MKNPSDIRVNLRYNVEKLAKAKEICRHMKEIDKIDVEPNESRFFWTMLDKMHRYYSTRLDVGEEYEKMKNTWGFE